VEPAPGNGNRVRFGAFELDLRSRELRKHGLKLRLQGQPIDLLEMLILRPGELVTREELRSKLWPEETFVDFEHGLNSAINRLRGALGDHAESPRYIETLPRLGYRFIATAVAPVSSPVDAPVHDWPSEGEARGAAQRRRMTLAAAAMVGALAILFIVNVAGMRDRILRLALPAPKIESIAVLPLANLSRDPEQEYFADGMTDALITDLGKIGALRVISRQSVMRFKGSRKPLPEIARELNVDAVVEGTVQHSGGRVRIAVQLLQGKTDRHLWAESYQRDTRDVLSLQSEVSQDVARQIKVALTPGESRRLAAVRSVNPEAYAFYLKGRYHYYKWTPDDFRKAIEYFQKAVDADPDWAPAYAGLATSYGWLWIQGGLAPQEALPRFSAALKTALAIDDADPEVRYALAASAFYYRWDWEAADREFQKAIALDPSLAEARFEYAWFLCSQRRFSEALTQAQLAVDRDPLSVTANLALGDICFQARQDQRAIGQLRRTAELEPNDSRAHGFLSGIYEEKEMYVEAIQEAQKAGAPPEKLAGLERAYRQSGARGYWESRLLEAKRRTAPFEIARVYARLGDVGQALTWLEKSYQQHDWRMVQLNATRAWDPVRADPRFQDLLHRLNFPLSHPIGA
jgi:TolB-like protein/DNA-binding winged helix-turn-helix (wHTH) protein/tetratricopeptide (TPR) repeat protein